MELAAFAFLRYSDDAALQALMPSRKLTYAATSVKGNIVNTNVYNNWNSSKKAAQTRD
jgi:hypothetical protein